MKLFNVKVSNLTAADSKAPDSESTVDGRGWPGYLFGGRVRTSTAALIVAFLALFWVHQTFTLPAVSEQTPQVVPPGFVPDPNYTWVPRTNVQPREPVTTTPTTTTETTSPTGTTTTSPTSPTETPPTVVDPDGLGPDGPQTITPTTPATTPTTTDGGGFGPIPLPTIVVTPR